MSEYVATVQSIYQEMRQGASTALVGQDAAFELIVAGLLSGGHVMLEGVPGTAKTLMAKLLARLIQADFHRIQFTPDLMPSDIVGTSVFDLQSGKFYLKRGPVFTQILLADEINRAPAKTQAALLEAMEERQVTLEGEANPLAFPFFVIATQNPVEYEGTYPLPEAQLDRFLFKILVPYPESDAELALLRRVDQGFSAQALDQLHLEPVVNPATLRQAMDDIQRVTVDDSILSYIATLIEATRNSSDILLGGSPRASIALLRACKTLAAMRGRQYVTPDDVQSLAHPVLRHRLVVRAEAEIENVTPDRALDRILKRVAVPR